jgi:hypothetical protein
MFIENFGYLAFIQTNIPQKNSIFFRKTLK